MLQNLDGYQVVNTTTPNPYLVYSGSYFLLLQIVLFMVFEDEGMSHNKSDMCGFYTMKQKIWEVFSPPLIKVDKPVYYTQIKLCTLL